MREKIEHKSCNHLRTMLFVTMKGNVRCAFCKKLWIAEKNIIEERKKNEKDKLKT